jgi:hypothetical protein
MLLIYAADPVRWGHPMFLHQGEGISAAERTEMNNEFEDLIREITESGELVGGEPLADPSITTTLRVRDGVSTATDGPFIESKEQLAGFFIVDCESPERAAEIATRLPDARLSVVEVRPIMELSGQEM